MFSPLFMCGRSELFQQIHHKSEMFLLHSEHHSEHVFINLHPFTRIT